MKKRLLTSIIALASVITLASCAGTSSDPITGATGPAGQNGQNGADGLNGVDGATWLFGSSDPSADLGAIGDLYLNTDTYDIYAKTESGWTLIGNIKGEDGLPGTDGDDGSDGLDGVDGTDGKDGATWLVGSTDPEDTIGEVGDLYLNDVTGDIFTKDESNNWRYIGNLKGDKGDTGEKGDDGLTAYSNTILPSENGYVLPSIGSALVGEEVTFTAYPDEGYTLASLTLNGEEVTATYDETTLSYSYTTEMVEGGYVVLAEFAKTISSEELGDALTNATEGDTIYLEEGAIYEVTSTLSVPSGVTIDGHGATMVIPETTLSGSNVNVFNLSGTNDLTLKNLTIDSEYNGGTNIGVHIQPGYEGDLVIDNVSFNVDNHSSKYMNHAIWVNGNNTGDIVIRNSTFGRPINFSATSGQVVRNVLVENNTFNYTYGLNGITVGGPLSNVTIRNNTLSGVIGNYLVRFHDDITISGNTDTTFTDVTISNNTIEGSFNTLYEIDESVVDLVNSYIESGEIVIE